MKLRPYLPEDAADLRRCFVALQDAEHDLVASAPTGEDIADDYLAWMWRRCRSCVGQVIVAEIEGSVVGFVCVLTQVPRSDPDDADPTHALIGELSVLPDYRDQGIGRRLVAAALAKAREAGASNVRLSVVAENTDAKALYRRLGFRSMIETFVLRLDDD